MQDWINIPPFVWCQVYSLSLFFLCGHHVLAVVCLSSLMFLLSLRDLFLDCVSLSLYCKEQYQGRETAEQMEEKNTQKERCRCLLFPLLLLLVLSSNFVSSSKIEGK